MRALADAPEEPQVPVPAPPPAWRSVLQRGGSGPPVDDSAIERAVSLHDARHGMRRPLALLRLARATARLADDPVVTADHVDERRCAHRADRAGTDPISAESGN